MAAPQVLIVAAEASSSLYAKRLLELWKKEKFQVSAFGVGSREMEALGFERLGRSEEMSIVGLQEVLSHYFDLKKVFNQLLEEAERRKPDFALLMDYSGFNLRLAERLKAQGCTVLYFISPQVWAWRKGRIQTIKKCVDKMHVILPFEKKVYDENQILCEFVGHPLLDELAPSLFDEKARQFERQKFGFQKNDFVLGLMPGSRRSELKFHLKAQVDAAQIVIKKHSHIKLAFLVADTFTLEEFRSYLPPIEIPCKVKTL